MVSSCFVMSVTMTFMLFIIFGYLSFAQKEKALGIWSIAWLVSSCRQLIVNWMTNNKINGFDLMINEVLIILAAFLFLLSTYYFTNRRSSKWLTTVFALESLWSVFCITYGIHFTLRIIPIILFLLHAYTKTGMTFLKDKETPCPSNIIFNITFISKGFMTVAFVILVNLTDILYLLTPWIFMLNFLIATIISVSLLDITLKKQLHKLRLSEAHYKKAIQDLKESEEHHRKILELLPDAIFIHKDRKPVMANAAALRLIKCSNFEDKEHLCFRIHPDYEEISAMQYEKLKSAETKVDFIEGKLILHDGDVIDVEAGGVSYLQDGEMYIISAFRDISERKRVEKLQQVVNEKEKQLKQADEYDRMKTEFFTTISHELKTPLNVIMSGIQLLSHIHTVNNGCSHFHSCMKYIGMMKQNCYRLMKLINNLIDITKLDSGDMNMNFMNHNIVNIIEDITMLVAQLTQNAGINLIFDTEIEEKIISCDAEKIERVMLNLLSNATKYTEPGGTIEVAVKEAGEYVSVSVKDTGIGIPEDKKNFIFERFGQVDSSLTRKKEGSGIGLSLVKSIIECHGGNITVQSEPGKGSEFTFMLPVRTSDDAPVSDEAAATRENNVERLSIEFSDIYS